MVEEEKQNEINAENKKRLFLALAILLGYNVNSYEEITSDQMNILKQVYDNNDLKKSVEIGERLSEQDLQKKISEIGQKEIDAEYFIVKNVGDERTCNACKKWIDKIVSAKGNDSRYKSVDDFISSGGLHVNCRCSLQKINVTEIPRKPPNPKAVNTVIVDYFTM